MGVCGQGFFQQPVIVSQPGPGGLDVPQMITYGPERMFLSDQPPFEKPGGKLGIFPSPALKIMIKSVHRNHIGFKDPHVAASNAGQPMGGFQTREKRHSKNMVDIADVAGQGMTDDTAE
jgi:hypothetical protein